MGDSIIDKIRKAAEARDKAIKQDAKKGMCAHVANLWTHVCVMLTWLWQVNNNV